MNLSEIFIFEGPDKRKRISNYRKDPDHFLDAKKNLIVQRFLYSFYEHNVRAYKKMLPRNLTISFDHFLTTGQFMGE